MVNTQYDQMYLYPRYALREGGKTFDRLQDAARAAGSVTFDPSYNDNFFGTPHQTYPRSTIFKEVACIPMQQPECIDRLLDVDFVTESIDGRTFGAVMADYIYDHLEKHWNGNQRHVMAHSSGYDSRILSGAIARLVEQHGREWVGDVHFYHFLDGYELEPFTQIMDIEGWGPADYTILTGKERHYDFLLDFDHVGAFSCEFYKLDPIHNHLLAESIPEPSNTVFLSGYLSDELLKHILMFRSPRSFLNRWVLDIPLWWSDFAGYMSPMHSAAMLKWAFTHTPDIDQYIVKLFATNHIYPAVAGIPHVNPKYEWIDENGERHMRSGWGLHGDGGDTFSTTAHRIAFQRLRNSWLYRTVPGAHDLPRAFVIKSPLMSFYAKAAVCEHLINEGVEVHL